MMFRTSFLTKLPSQTARETRRSVALHVTALGLVRINIAVTFGSVLIEWLRVYPALSGIGVKGFLRTDGNQWLCADRMDVNVKSRYTRHLVPAFAYRV